MKSLQSASVELQKSSNVKRSALVDACRSNDALTHNGSITNSTSLNECLDFFFLAGASHSMSDEDIKKIFSSAYTKDRKTALKILFWARDVRGGAGERRLFRVCLEYLKDNQPKDLSAITRHIPEYGRWDDIFFGDIDQALEAIDYGIKTNDRLMFKWLPREKSANGHIAKLIMKELVMSPRTYRQMLSAGSEVVETKMSQKKWEEIDYSHVPSNAFNKYRKAFMRNDESRFTEFVGAVNDGEEKINASAIHPHDIYRSWNNGGADSQSINAQWKSLPDYGNEESILPVCDVSGSMTGTPMEVSVALGVYLSERNSGAFKDVFCTFSSAPKLQVLNGPVSDRFSQLSRAEWGMNTDLNSVFAMIVRLYDEGKVKKEDIPSKILVISDMEFDSCASQTNYQAADTLFRSIGVPTPQIVFWNVNGRAGNVPVSRKDKRVALISGFSPSILKSVLGGEDLSPVGVMNKTINTDRYSFIDNL